MQDSRPDEGFSLVELLISITILATGLLALASTLVTSSHSRVDDAARSRVLVEAQNVMEEIRGQNPATLMANYDGYGKKVAAIPGANNATGTVQVAIDDSEPTLLRVTLTGTWNVSGATGTFQLMSSVRNF